MKERKVKHMKSNHVRQRRRSWLLSPVIIAELVVVLAIAGVSVAYAFPQNTVIPDSAPWAGTASITETANLDVTDYQFGYTANLSQVDEVTIEITATGAQTADIELVILDAGGAVEATGSLSSEPCPNGASDHVVTLSVAVELDQIVTLNIVLTEL
jgi:hypothetical protein